MSEQQPERPTSEAVTARLLDVLTRGDHDQHDGFYRELYHLLKSGWAVVPPARLDEDEDILVSRAAVEVALGAAIASGLPFSTEAVAALSEVNDNLGQPFDMSTTQVPPSGE